MLSMYLIAGRENEQYFFHPAAKQFPAVNPIILPRMREVRDRNHHPMGRSAGTVAIPVPIPVPMLYHDTRAISKMPGRRNAWNKNGL